MSNILPDNLLYKEMVFTSDEADAGSRDEPTFFLDKNVRDIRQVRIDGVEFPNSYFVFNSNTNQVKFTESGQSEATATITAGNYTSTSMTSELKSALEAASPGTLTYTVSLDSSTLKLTISPSAGTLIINGDDSTAGEFIGFTTTNSTAASVTGNQTINLSGPNYLLLHSNLASMYNRSFYLDGKSANDVVARIPIHANSSEVVFYDASSRPYHQVNHGDLSQVSYYLTDEVGRRMALNGGIISVYISMICVREEH